jgi:adenylyltransferase/sulfurtransferase
MVREISPTEFVARRDAGDDLLLLDVREPHELAIASVPGAVHIPMGQVPERLAELDPKREIVVLCRSGGRSLQVARFLESRGYGSVANLTGGTLAWSRDVDPSLPTY